MGSFIIIFSDFSFAQEPQDLFVRQFGLGTLEEVALSPDGSIAATVGGGGVFLWSTADGKQLRNFGGHAGAITAVAFSPDGSQLLTGSSDNTARLWSVTDGHLLHIFSGHTDFVYSVAYSPDGTKILTGSRDRTARLWSVAEGNLVQVFSGPSSVVSSVAFSPDGSLILCGYWDGSARLWSAANGNLSHTFSGHTDFVYSVSFSPDGDLVLTGSRDNTARLWSVDNGSVIQTFIGHSSSITSGAFSPNGSLVVTGSTDDTARLWSVENGSLMQTFTGHSSSIRSVAFSPDGRQILTGSSDEVRLWSVDDENVIFSITGHSQGINSVAFSPNGNQVLTGSNDNSACLWSASDGSMIHTFTGHVWPVYAVAFSPDGNQMLTGSNDSTARLWSVPDGSLIQTFTGHSGGITSVAFSPDGRQILTGSNDSTARLWSVEDGGIIRTFQGHTGRVNSVVFSPIGNQVLTGSDDYTARLWSVADGSLIQTFTGHSSGITSVAFSPEGNQALSGGRDNLAQLWTVPEGSMVRSFNGHTGSVLAVTFSPDGTQILTGSTDRSVRLWSVADGELLQIFHGHKDIVRSAAFSPDGKLVLTGSRDGRVFLWKNGTPHSPWIADPPQSRSVLAGTITAFQVEAQGDETLQYQWRGEGEYLIDDSNYSGANTPRLLIRNAQLTNAGYYDVVVTNPFGSTTSTGALLEIVFPDSDSKFIGSFNPSVEFHNNIRNFTGVLEETTELMINVEEMTSGHYKVTLSDGTQSLVLNDLQKSGQLIRNDVRPLSLPDVNVLDFIMMSDGTNRAFVMVAQELDDADDVSVTMGSWSSYSGPVTISDFVGYWDIERYADPNLRSTGDGFAFRSLTVEIQQIDANHINLIVPEDDTTIPLVVAGNEAYLESPIVFPDSTFQTFRIQTDGQRMSFHLGVTEPDDVTDLSATVGLGVKQSGNADPYGVKALQIRHDATDNQIHVDVNAGNGQQFRVSEGNDLQSWNPIGFFDHATTIDHGPPSPRSHYFRAEPLYGPLTWMKSVDMPVARDSFTSGAIGNNLYVFGGNGDPDGINLKRLDIYNLDTGAWTRGADYAVGIEEVRSAVVDGKFYVFGGWAGSLTRINIVYDPASNTWNETAPKPTIVSLAPTVSWGNKIIIVGGDIGDDFPGATEVEVYETETDSWQLLTNLPYPVQHPAVAIYQDVLYVIGGADLVSLTAYNKIFRFDLLSETWLPEITGVLPYPIIATGTTAAPVVNGKIIIGGGVTTSAGEFSFPDISTDVLVTDFVTVYDVETGNFTQNIPLPERFGSHAFLLVKDRLFSFGGYSGPSILEADDQRTARLYFGIFSD